MITKTKFYLTLLIAFAGMAMVSQFNGPRAVTGKIIKVERTENAAEIQAVITAEHARIKFFFVKAVPYESPARIDVIAKDINGQPWPFSAEEILEVLPDSLFRQYHLPKK